MLFRRRAGLPRSSYTWLCPSEIDRERLLNAVTLTRRTRPVMLILIIAVVFSTPGDGRWWVLGLAVVVAGSTIWLYGDLARRRRPEYWAAAGWLMTQTPLAVGIALTGGPNSRAVSWLAVGVVSLVARFSRRAIRVGMAYLFTLLAAVTIGINPAEVISTNGWSFLAPAMLLFSMWVFAECMMRSDLSSQTEDRVTGLANYAAFKAHLTTELTRCAASGGCCIVLDVDLDGFRLPNDTLGAAFGDDLLRQAARRISEAIGPGATVARRSADEFLVLNYEADSRDDETESMWAVGVQRAQPAAERIQAAFGPAFSVGDSRDVYLSASIGIAVSGAGPPDAPEATTAATLLSHAQSAINEAKTIGPRGRMVYRGEDHGGPARLSLLGRLHHALDRNEFRLHYQPVVDMHTRELIGVEALLRWQDPERGIVMPGEFISLAEDAGLIVPIGEWVVSEAARQRADWASRGLNLDVAFNVSPRQLGSPDIVPHILQALDRHGVRAQDMIVEITESYALSDPERTLPLLHSLVDHGLRLAIDDFGTGLSSLGRLRDIPADILKIDRSFVQDLSTDPRGESMISVIVDLARHFGMTPHAEGVETESERRTLLRLGCQQAQGFLFSRAVEASEIERMAGRATGSLNGVPRVPLGGAALPAG